MKNAGIPAAVNMRASRSSSAFQMPNSMPSSTQQYAGAPSRLPTTDIKTTAMMKEPTLVGNLSSR